MIFQRLALGEKDFLGFPEKKNRHIYLFNIYLYYIKDIKKPTKHKMLLSLLYGYLSSRSVFKQPEAKGLFVPPTPMYFCNNVKTCVKT